MDEQLEFLKLIVSRLDSAGVPYMLTGSMALAVYALPRMTRVLDLVIECGPGDVDKITRLFASDCYFDEESVRTAIKNKTMFNIIPSAAKLQSKELYNSVSSLSKAMTLRFTDARLWLSMLAPWDNCISNGARNDARRKRLEARCL